MKVKSQLQRIVLSLASLALLEFSPAKANEDINKFTTELTYTEDDHFVKFRPFDYTSGTQRNDLLLGKKFNDLIIWGYWKADDKKEIGLEQE